MHKHDRFMWRMRAVGPEFEGSFGGPGPGGPQGPRGQFPGGPFNVDRLIGHMRDLPAAVESLMLQRHPPK